jgi:hypothetical protein
MIMVNHSILAPLRRGALFWEHGKKKPRLGRGFKMTFRGPTRHHSGAGKLTMRAFGAPSIRVRLKDQPVP